MTVSKNNPPVINTGVFSSLMWWLGDLVAYAAIGFAGFVILWVLHDPWVNIGYWLVGADSPLPGVSFIGGVPYVGHLISAWMRSPVYLVATVLMVACNICQFLYLMKTKGYLKIGKAWGATLEVVAIAGWLIEIVVALLEHPIYLSGWAGIKADFPMLDLAYVQWGELASVAVLMFLFEVSIVVCALLIISLKKNRMREKAERQAQIKGAA